MRPTLSLLALTFFAGCGADIASGKLGVTQGGSQDIGYARGLIEDGFIPSADQFTAEGLFSEHDLPLDGERCEAVLCPRAAATIHHPYTGEPQALVQLGFDTNLSMGTFERPNLDLALLVDTSGSMDGAPLELTKAALHDLIDQLGPDDHASLSEFGSKARVLQRAKPMDSSHKQALHDAVDALETNGSTDMESGMRRAYDEIDAADGRSGRLMVFSDAMPNTGLTATSDFVKLVREQADRGVGLSFFGVGQLGAELAATISEVRGGNSYFLSEASRPELFGADFHFLVTPLAYDLEVTFTPSDAGFALGEVYGAPVDGDQVAIGASTLFLSRQGGGIGVTLSGAPVEPATLGTLALAYRPADGGARVQDSLAVAWHGGLLRDDADALGVYRMDGLVLQVEAMLAAAAVCESGEGAESAVARLQAAEAELRARADAITDDALRREADLMAKLALNVGVTPLPCMSGDY